MTVSSLSDEEILAASVLPARPAKPRNPAVESQALDALIGRISAAPGQALQALVETVAELCDAGSSGVSLLENGHFVWPAVAGAWAPYVNQGLPKDAAPCGVVVDRGTALLFDRPELIFPEVGIEPAIQEVLLVPLHFDGERKGTLWAISHDSRRFDAEDVRILNRLALFASAIEQVRRAAAAQRRGPRARGSVSAPPCRLFGRSFAPAEANLKRHRQAR